MDDNRVIQNLKTIPTFNLLLEKLMLNPQEIDYRGKVCLLSCAIRFIRKYELDKRYTKYLELAYYIILKYSISFGDYKPLYDFSVNIGFYPIAQVITEHRLIELQDISSSLIPNRIEEEFKRNNLIETKEQKVNYETILNTEAKEICFVAPTSFGKSSIIVDHIEKNLFRSKKVAIIVPTKSLLMQTYRTVKKKKLNVRLLIHDEMYNGEDNFIAVFTQERALRLLEVNEKLSFDTMYIDEAHKLFERDQRSFLLFRLIKLNRMRNDNTKILYFSPLISEVDNLKINENDSIYEQHIKINIKEPEYYEYRLDNSVYKYNRFLNEFYKMDETYENIFQYIKTKSGNKVFCYLYTPKKIELFSKNLADNFDYIQNDEDIREIINNLVKYIHKDFYVVEYLKKGIIYLHGKIPEEIKDYLEYKYSKVRNIRYLVANNVILEGVNLPVDTLFILSGGNLNGKSLTNLIGRVNRLDQIFGNYPRLYRLLPQVHFVNSQKYNRKNSKFENKIVLLKSNIFPDEVENPLLASFDKSHKNDDSIENIIQDDNRFFDNSDNPINKLARDMVSLGMSSIYNINEELCDRILKNINKLKEDNNCNGIHFLKRLQMVFIKGIEYYIIDKEFKRLKNDKALFYYKIYFENRVNPLKENILREIQYFKNRVKKGDSRLFIGNSYGEINYDREIGHNVYIDLATKNTKELVNIAIVKQKIEQDFVSYKLNMFFSIMLDYDILTQEEYNEIVYGTNDSRKLNLLKTGLTLSLISRLEADNQLINLDVDSNGNISITPEFEEYLKRIDDFYKFQLSKFI